MAEGNPIPADAKLVDVVRINGEQHGAPEETAPVYELPDGNRVQGESTPLREGIRIVGGQRRLVALDPSESIDIGL